MHGYLQAQLEFSKRHCRDCQARKIEEINVGGGERIVSARLHESAQQVFERGAQVRFIVAIFHNHRRVEAQAPLSAQLVAFGFTHGAGAGDHHRIFGTMRGSSPSARRIVPLTRSKIGVPRVRMVPAASTAPLRTMVPS